MGRRDSSVIGIDWWLGRGGCPADRDDLTTSVEPTVWAGVVWQAHLSAVRTQRHCDGVECKVRATFAAPGTRDFPFWKRGHYFILLR